MFGTCFHVLADTSMLRKWRFFFFILVFTSYSTTRGLSARNEIEGDQGLEEFEEVG